ncbi:DUF3108 domain-containing protein [Ruegeria sp. 2012CJ41-6]|uniref:DUF3108 domain-containing protein n=1 Tax=Ruegeria spongiae TaxID=2942209 RepID=A0ABT0Q6D2_9RHOB|nr:DUF3108 domain-containing protein [Ruegeria spongiae]MCL6285117.1 DUF3108 domain-containing protein [Ruegeria spongiae]
MIGVLLLLCLPGLVAAQQTEGQYDVRALGAKVGDLALSGTVKGSRYAVASRFETTGLVNALSGVWFQLKSNGRVQGNTFQPRNYTEEMNTGRRQSKERLTYSGGVARRGDPDTGRKSRYAVTDAEQKGALDPLTALFAVMRDQPAEGLCDLTQRVFDGKRLTELAMTRRTEAGPLITCHGIFRRVGGYSPEDLKRKRNFEVTVTYAPAGELMRLVEVRADTLFGPATVLRR